MRILMLALLSVFLALPVAAQVVVGGTGGATMLLKDGHVTNVGSVLGEVEYQFPWSDAEDPKNWGGLVAYVGVNTEGGGEQLGLAYRHYVRTGSVYPGIGLGGFTLGSETPEVTELSIFVGPEAVLEIPMSSETDDKVTGFLGVYPVVAGGSGVTVVRAGIRAAFN